MRVLAFIFGVILLLPGACSLGFMAILLGSGSLGDIGPLPLLWLICFAISFGGIMMIRSAIRGSRPRDPSN
ncbi:MAG TPA: hypothetical protein VN715_09015 [Roseiarcus sp.]|nr:hypothetical protein [Roseiarcus sp.]